MTGAEDASFHQAGKYKNITAKTLDLQEVEINSDVSDTVNASELLGNVRHPNKYKVKISMTGVKIITARKAAQAGKDYEQKVEAGGKEFSFGYVITCLWENSQKA